jgi:hypothetical protein
MSTLSGGPNIVTDGLVLHLDAANPKSYVSGSTTWGDLSRGGNNGTLVNGPTFSSANGGSIVFDGTNDYVSITENSGMRPAILSAELIFKINSKTNTSSGGAPPTLQYLLFRQNSRTGNFEGYAMTYTEDNDSIHIVSTPSGGTPQSVAAASNNSILLSNVYIVTGIWKETTQELYINGQYITESAKSPNINYNNTHTLKIGRTVPVGNSWDAASNGNIYSVKIYNRALSAQEVLQNYNTTKTRFGL